MRDLRTLPINLLLSSPAIHGENSLSNMSELLPTWKRSICRIGGFWLGTATLKGDQFRMIDLFLNGIGNTLREMDGGATTWQGFLGRMELTLNGITYVRDWLDIANKIKDIYTRIGDNLLTNGSAETGAWAAIGGATSVQDTSWRTDGTYSDHITTTGATKGATVQTGIAVVEGKTYDLTADVNIISGTWAMEVYKIVDNTILASAIENVAGLKQMRCSIPATSTFSGNVGIKFRCRIGAAEGYFDNVVFGEAPIKADTGWHEDLNSQAKYGQHWLVLLEGSLTDQAATSKVLTYLKKHAWARTVMPDQFGGSLSDEDQLAMIFYGDAYTLRQKTCLFSGSDQMDNTLNKIFLETEIVTVGKIDINTTSYQIDNRAPLTHWEIIQGILKVGDTNGAIWSGGCYEDHKFYYKKLNAVPVYHYGDGVLFSASGTSVIPWEVRPDVVFTDDMPTGPGQNATALDDPRCFVVDEVEFGVADYIAGKNGLTFTRSEDL